jgi:hypothetical protein
LYRELRQLEDKLEKEPSAAARRADAPARKVSAEDPTLVMGDEHAAPAEAPKPRPTKRFGGRLVAVAAAMLVAVAVIVLAPWQNAPPSPAPQAAAPIVAVAPPIVQEPPEPQPTPPVAAPEKPPEPAPRPKAQARAAKKPGPAPVAAPEPAPPPVEVAVAPPPKPVPPPPPQTGKIVLAVSPWGEVYVNGRLQGTTPPLAEVELPPGRHRVEIRNSAQLPYHTFVELQAGQTQPIRYSFSN